MKIKIAAALMLLSFAFSSNTHALENDVISYEISVTQANGKSDVLVRGADFVAIYGDYGFGAQACELTAVTVLASGAESRALRCKIGETFVSVPLTCSAARMGGTGMLFTTDDAARAKSGIYVSCVAAPRAIPRS